MQTQIKNNISVSIVMTTYNGEKFLDTQIQSILNQTWKNINLIICDDASTDKTKNIIKEFAEKDKRITYFFNETNIGVNKNFEKGFLKTESDFIAIADQDDVWKENKIEEMLSLFYSDEIILVHSASVEFSGNRLPSTNSISSIQMKGNDPKKLVLRNSISGHNIIFKKSLLNIALPLPNGLYYDWWLVVNATCAGKIDATNKVLAFHRKHDNNVTLYNRTTNKQTRKEFFERRNALEQFIKIEAMDESDKKFCIDLLKGLKTLENKEFSMTLFIFLMKNSKVLFYYKNKKFPYFSYLKTAYRMSFAVA